MNHNSLDIREYNGNEKKNISPSQYTTRYGCHVNPSRRYINKARICANIVTSCGDIALNLALSGEYAWKWQQALQDEYDILQANNTWDKVSLPPGQAVVDSKWVLKIQARRKYFFIRDDVKNNRVKLTYCPSQCNAF